MRRFLILSALLVACSNPIFGVSIQDISANIPAATSTGGQVVYPVSASTFNQPTIAFTSVKLRGNSSASALSLSTVKMYLYARKDSPATNGDCTQSAGVYICPASSQVKITSALVTFKADGAKTPFVVDDSSGKLKEAINAGTMWLGFEITEGFSANMTVKLSELVADVTIL